MTKRTKLQQSYSLPIWRFYLVLGICLAMFAGLGVRAAWIQVFDNEHLKKEGDSRVIRYQGINGQRGIIKDRNGKELAISVAVHSAWINPKKILQQKAKYPDFFETSAWSQLADTVDMTAKELTQFVESRPTRQQVWLRRHIEPTRAGIIRRLKLPGVSLALESKRFYPDHEVAAHLVGFTNTDEVGIEGIERAFNDRLKGEDGSRRIKQDRRGNHIEEADVVDSAVNGEDIQLSIDMRIQTNAYKVLKSAVKQYRAKGGTAVVIDIDTGEVLAMVNQPSYNPNNTASRLPNAVRNRAVTDVFELGSAAKPLTALSALLSGKYSHDTIIDTSPGRLQLGGRTVRDVKDHGKISISQIIAKSSNVGTSLMALSMDDDTFLESFYAVGFGSKTASGFPGEVAGRLNIRRNWSDIEKAALSYGYGVNVTALQLAKAYAIIGGLGKSRPISLLKVNGPVPYEQVFDPRVASQVVEMMAHVVSSEEGTGRKAALEGYKVSGKTGTAFKATAGSYGDDYFAVFAGVAPVRNPRVSVVVMIDDPRGEKFHGGEVAAPIFAGITQDTLRILNIAPDSIEPMIVDRVGD